MATPSPRVFRWGIISTGWMAGKFVDDLLIDPKTRDVRDVVHKVVAVASRDVKKADDFVKDHVSTVQKDDSDPKATAYGSYDELYADENIDVVYVGTPHTQHYPAALGAIRAGKNVLCEKPVTANSFELKSLIAEAKKHNVFFMEAMWTKFQPLVREVKKILDDEGELGVGRPVVLYADFSMNFRPHDLPLMHRLVDPKLGGGAMLDLGPYPLAWALMTILEHPANNLQPPSSIQSSVIKFAPTGVDQNTTITLTFSNPTSTWKSSSDTTGPKPFTATAILHSSLTIPDPTPGAVIRCERGTIEIHAPIPRSTGFTVKYYNGPGEGEAGKVKKEFTREFEYEGFGWHFQADEVARCVWGGKLESEQWGHEKSLVMMSVFDEVRRQCGYVFPEGVEHVVGDS
ncbi:hypothetical protein BDV98DRAFT_568546 [Pterulicium gracile]|uniref:D-xylose 1-dehydrogenase (NADP(+), D-xylono-1,5-lactone-forming) n=1 Tax=Pterulicium gracile TaxID=1884261 RepID=A0A5C3QHB5_9AGAR|nr:hypothetical protein BDV98DRAFT_568546 [Pterula gracilis]